MFVIIFILLPHHHHCHHHHHLHPPRHPHQVGEHAAAVGRRHRGKFVTGLPPTTNSLTGFRNKLSPVNQILKLQLGKQ